MNTNSFNTSFLIDAVEKVAVVVDGVDYDIGYYARDDELEHWVLRTDVDAAPEHSWVVPDQYVVVADTGMCAIKDSQDQVLLLAFTKTVAMTPQELKVEFDVKERARLADPHLS